MGEDEWNAIGILLLVTLGSSYNDSDGSLSVLGIPNMCLFLVTLVVTGHVLNFC